MVGNYAATDNMLKQLIFLAIASASYTALFAVTSGTFSTYLDLESNIDASFLSSYTHSLAS